MKRPKIVGYISEYICQLDIDVAKGAPIFLSESTMQHIREKHPEAYMKYFDLVEEIISSPDYIGIAGVHAPSIEYVKCYKEADENINIAVRASKGGTLYLRSMFLIDDGRITDYVKKGKLQRISCASN